MDPEVELGTDTYGASSRLLEAIRALEGLEASGDIRPAEQQALNRARERQGAAREEVARTRASYRGVAQGALFNSRDELSGAIAALRGGDYGAARDAVRDRDEAAQVLYPDEYGRGRVAGAGVSAVAPLGGAMRVARGMGTAGRMGVGAAEGLGIGGLDGFMGGEGAGDRLQGSAPGAIAGAVIGAAAPVVGRMAGGVTRSVRNAGRTAQGVHPMAGRAVSDALFTADRSGTDVRAYLNSLGPEGMISDIPGAPQRLAQGVAALPGEPAQAMVNAIEGRAQGAGARVRGDMNANLGRPGDAEATRAALAAERNNDIGPLYDAATAHPTPLDASPITNILTRLEENSVGNVRSALRSLSSDIGSGPVAAIKLHNMRSELSDAISEATRSGRGKFVAQMRPVLREIDGVLDKVPNYTVARTRYAENMAAQVAVTEGRGVFTGGTASAMSPTGLRAMLNDMSPRERVAFRQGAREWVSGLMGTARNDAASAWGLIQRDWNAEKLEVLLGQGPAEAVLRRLRAEEAFSRTRGNVVAGSQTHMRAEAANALADFRDPQTMNRPGPIARVRNVVNDAGNRAIDSALYGPRRAAANEDIGRVMTATGIDRDQLVQDLMTLAQERRAPSASVTAASRLLELVTGVGGTATAAHVNNNR